MFRVTVSTNSILGNRHFVVIMTSLFVTLPLSLHKNIAKLNKVGLLICQEQRTVHILWADYSLCDEFLRCSQASFTSLIFILLILIFVIGRMASLGGTM